MQVSTPTAAARETGMFANHSNNLAARTASAHPAGAFEQVDSPAKVAMPLAN
jgi:hypothetical protein